MKNDKITIGERLKTLRFEKKWSQAVLAQKVKIEQKQISKYERDEVLPGAETLINLSKIFGTTIDFILLGELNGQAAKLMRDKEMLDLFEQISTIDDSQKFVVMELLKAFIIKNKVADMKI